MQGLSWIYRVTKILILDGMMLMLKNINSLWSKTSVDFYFLHSYHVISELDVIIQLNMGMIFHL